MKKIIIVICLICTMNQISAQKVHYEKTFEKALEKAIQQKKPIVILTTSSYMPPANQNMTYFDDKEVIEKLNSEFIVYKLLFEDTATKAIVEKYRIYRFPSLTFLNPKGDYLFNEIYFSRAEFQLSLLNRAITEFDAPSLFYYDSIYNGGNRTRDFLKAYIKARQKAEIFDNQNLIEEYVITLDSNDFKNYNEVSFILSAGPVITGKAYELIHSDKTIVPLFYQREPFEIRKTVNDRIIINSLKKAIDTKNIDLAYHTASFTRGTWSNDNMEGRKSFDYKLIEYFQGIHDTSNYLMHASIYFDKYYMQIKIDSVKKMDSLNIEKAKENARVISIEQINKNTMRQVATFSYKMNQYPTELNNAAWNFYMMVTNKDQKSRNYLYKALEWSKRSIEFSQEAFYYDTYAHLLYSLELFNEAEQMQKKAIEIAHSEKQDTKRLKEELYKIRKRSL